GDQFEHGLVLGRIQGDAPILGPGDERLVEGLLVAGVCGQPVEQVGPAHASRPSSVSESSSASSGSGPSSSAAGGSVCSPNPKPSLCSARKRSNSAPSSSPLGRSSVWASSEARFSSAAT